MGLRRTGQSGSTHCRSLVRGEGTARFMVAGLRSGTWGKREPTINSVGSDTFWKYVLSVSTYINGRCGVPSIINKRKISTSFTPNSARVEDS